MSFLTEKFVPNFLDVMGTGVAPFDLALVRSELMSDHRISQRRFLADMFPKGGVGAEIGVFTGLFSSMLLRRTRAQKIYFVDPWWEVFGARYPDWGAYTDRGRLATSSAHRAACGRIAHNAHGVDTSVFVGRSDDFLDSLPDAHLDWIYLDSTHSYEGTRDELELLRPKLKPGGMVGGDDWHEDGAQVRAGVAQAVREAVAVGDYHALQPLDALQWMVRRA